ISLPLAGQACSVALSLPVTEHHRLLDAAQALRDRSTGLLLALVLATNPTSSTMPTPGPPSEPEAPRPSALWTPSPALAAPPSLGLHRVGYVPHLIITSR
ncbi:hypothetical protein, partial [Streptomyces sp. NPDC054975]